MARKSIFFLQPEESAQSDIYVLNGDIVNSKTDTLPLYQELIQTFEGVMAKYPQSAPYAIQQGNTFLMEGQLTKTDDAGRHLSFLMLGREYTRPEFEQQLTHDLALFDGLHLTEQSTTCLKNIQKVGSRRIYKYIILLILILFILFILNILKQNH